MGSYAGLPINSLYNLLYQAEADQSNAEQAGDGPAAAAANARAVAIQSQISAIYAPYADNPAVKSVLDATAPTSPTIPITSVPAAGSTPAAPPATSVVPAAGAPAGGLPTTPLSSSPPKQQPHDLFVPGGYADIGAYCDVYPDDPYCVYYGALQNAGIPGTGGGVTNVTQVQYNAGVLASDVHGIVNEALAGLWGVVVTAVDVAFGSLFSQLQQAITSIGNALKAVWNILSRLSGLILQFLSKMWYTVLHALVLAVQDIAGALKQVYDHFLKPLLAWLIKVRKKILDIWKRFVLPVLIVIQDIRRVLTILAAFHVKFAAKLDQQLGQIEAKITQPLLLILGSVNQLANWINLIATAGYLLQKPIFLGSLKAYVGSAVNLQVNAMTKPIGSAQLSAFQQSAALPTAAQSSSAAVDYIQTGAGINATIGDQQRSALQGYLSSGF